MGSTCRRCHNPPTRAPARSPQPAARSPQPAADHRDHCKLDVEFSVQPPRVVERDFVLHGDVRAMAEAAAVAASEVLVAVGRLTERSGAGPIHHAAVAYDGRPVGCAAGHRSRTARPAGPAERPTGHGGSAGGTWASSSACLRYKMNGRYRDRYLAAVAWEAGAGLLEFAVSPVFTGGHVEGFRWLDLARSGAALRCAPDEWVLHRTAENADLLPDTKGSRAELDQLRRPKGAIGRHHPIRAENAKED